jgi:hypothetical protein
VDSLWIPFPKQQNKRDPVCPVPWPPPTFSASEQLLGSQELARQYAPQTYEMAGASPQIFRSKRVTGFVFSISPGFAGFLPSQSATDSLWIASGAVFSGQ